MAIDVDGNTIFFHHDHIIAVRIDTTLYRTDNLKGGIVYQRIRTAVQASPGVKHISFVTKQELQEHAENILALAVSNTFNERILR